MKKMMMTLIAMLTMTVSVNAMSFEQARNEALFLTDKMAYTLHLLSHVTTPKITCVTVLII